MNKDDLGQIEILYDQPLIAGQLVTVVFEYTVGRAGLTEGGRLRLGLPCVSWSAPTVRQYYFWSEYAKGKDWTQVRGPHLTGSAADFRWTSPAVTCARSSRPSRTDGCSCGP